MRPAAEGGAVADAGVDDQEGDRAVGGAGFVEGAVDRVAVGNVALDGGAVDNFRRALQRIQSPAEDRDLGAGGVEMGGGGGANSCAAAGDQCMPACKPVILGHAVPFNNALAERPRGGKAD